MRRLALAGLVAAVVLAGGNAFAGAFLNGAVNPNLRTHSQNFFGVGGDRPPVRVCLDTGVNAAMAIQAEPTVLKVIGTLNRFHSLGDHNLAVNPATDMPAGMTDFESVLLHEILHTQGLDHPHLAEESGLPWPAYRATRSLRGADGVYTLGAGPDGIVGTPDDDRGDDENLDWYVRGVNDPGVLPVRVDTTTLSHALDYLPASHRYAAAPTREALAALGHADAESVMVQGTSPNEVQRHLYHDDLATLRLAQAGLDGIEGTDDDYRVSFVYRGRSTNTTTVDCEVSVRFDNTTAFATTTTSADEIVHDHIAVWCSFMRFNPGVNWFFSPAPNTSVSLTAASTGASTAPLTVRAAVAKAAGNPMAGHPQGTVEVRDGPRGDAGTATCTMTLAGTADETGECQLVPRRSGTRTLVADYVGYGGFDGSTASVSHVTTGDLAFGNVQHLPASSAVGGDVEFRWTLSTDSGQPAAAGASGTVTVTDAAQCGAPPTNPAHQCSVALPADRCSVRFAGAGSYMMRLCYSGDAVFAPVSATATHSVTAGRATATTIVSRTPAASAPLEPVAVAVRVAEAPSAGGNPAGTVEVRDGPAGDVLTATCAVRLAGTAGETGTCTLVPLRAGAKTITASYAVQGSWAASSATAAHTVGSLAIARRAPGASRAGQGVAVVVGLDVAPRSGTPQPTGTVTVSDGTDQCQIVLPATECLWRGSTVGLRQLVASWPGDANYAARTSAAVGHAVVADTYPQWISLPRTVRADADGTATTTRFALSADARYLVFVSGATNLVDDGGNGTSGVFVRDLATGAVRRASTSASGEPANGASEDAAISANGRYVSFASFATNLVPGDTNGRRDLFVKDLATGGIVRASLRDDGTQDGTSTDAYGLKSSLSADGRYVAFATEGALSRSDGSRYGIPDVYVRDLATGALDLVSSDSRDRQGDFRSITPAISADGRYVAFVSSSFNFPGPADFWPRVYVKDRLTRRLVLASTKPDGTPGDYADSDPVISADGRVVAFVSRAWNLPGPYNNDYNVYAKDLATGAIDRMNLDAAGRVFGRGAGMPAISADGRYVAFGQQVYAPGTRIDAYRKDRQTGALVNLGVDPAGVPVTAGDSGNPSLSADGRYVAFQSASARLVAGDDNGVVDAFVRDVQNSTTRRASDASQGLQPDGDSGEAAASRDGRYVVFSSLAGNLAAGDGDAQRDVFVHDRNAASVVRVSGNGPSDSPSVSADGGWIAFRSDASDLVAGDTNARADVFVKNRATGAVVRASTSGSGAQATGGALGPTGISSNGTWAVFGATDGGLVANDTNGVADVFAKNLGTGAIVLASSDAAGTPGNGESAQAAISDDGTRVAFATSATNLAADDTNGVRDVYVKTLAGGAIVRASSTAAGLPGNGASGDPAISADGRVVAFASAASNLVAGDTNGKVDIFVKNLDDGSIVRVNTSATGGEGAGGDCGTPSLSGDARYVGFVCAQAGLVADGGSAAGFFVKDRQTGAIRRVSTTAAGAPADAASTATKQALADDGTAVFASAAGNLATGRIARYSDVYAQRYAAAGAMATTTLIATHAPDPVAVGQSYTVAMTVTRSSGTAAIGGSVAVSDGDASCNATLTGSGATATGQCTLLALRPGVRRVTASYTGDAVYAASSAPPVNHRVNGSRVPSAPRIASAMPGDASVSVDFSAPDDAGDSPVASYRATCGAANASGTASPLVVSGLANGIAVTCTVVATNAAGDGAASAPSVSVVPATVPGAPTGVAITRGDRQVSIAFAAGTNGGSAILDYTAQCGTASRSAAGSPIVIGALANGTPVTCRVSARNAAGRGAASSPVSATPATVPEAPTGVTAVRGDARATVSFIQGNNGGDAITGYTARCGAASANGAASPVVVSGLANGTAVTCTVTATNGVGTSVPSAPSASVTPATVPGAPRLIAATSASGAAQLLFVAPAQNGGATITRYTGTCTPGGFTATATVSPVRVTGLANGTAYSCSVQAVNDVGTGAASNAMSVTPRPPVNLAISIDNGTDYLQGGTAVSYLVDVVNLGGDAVAGARVVHAPPATFADVSWVCSAQGGGTCPASGAGAIDVRVDLPPDASLSFLVSGIVAKQPETPASFLATVAVPPDLTDADPADNIATDGPHTVGLFRSGFE